MILETSANLIDPSGILFNKITCAPYINTKDPSGQLFL